MSNTNSPKEVDPRILNRQAMDALLVRLDTTIHSPNEVQRMLGLPVIGATPLSAEA